VIRSPDYPGRAEFAASPILERNPFEDPEAAYRRGYQQGAHAVMKALPPGELRQQVKNFVNKIGEWRYAKRRRFGRHVVQDRPPTLEIKTGNTKRDLREAALRLMELFEANYDTEFVKYIYLTYSWLGAKYSDDSSGGLVEFR
jgi:hypothetical protein